MSSLSRSLYGRFLKSATLCFSVVFLSFPAVFGASNVTQQEKNFLKQVVADGGKGWLCEWDIVVPDRLPDYDGKLSISAVRGLSDVEINSEHFEDYTEYYLDVPCFYGDYRVRVYVAFENDGDGEPTFTSELRLRDLIGERASQGLRGRILNSHTAYPAARYDEYDYPFDKDWIWKIEPSNINFTAFTAVLASPDTLKMALNERADGYVLLQGWDGVKPPTTNAKPKGDFLYVENVRFKIYKATEGAMTRGSMTVAGHTTDFPVALSQTGDVLTISNLYNRGAEYEGDVWKYNLSGGYTLSRGCVLASTDGRTAVLDGNRAGALEFHPQALMYDTTDKYARLQANSSTLRFTDHLIMTEEQFEQLPGPPNSSEAETFYATLQSLNDPLTGRVVSTAVNSHWDRIDGSRVVVPGGSGRLVFPPHYLVPINYLYTYTDQPNYYQCYRYEPAQVIKIDELSVDMGQVDDSESDVDISFIRTDFGIGAIDAQSDDEYIYLSGSVQTSGPQVDLFMIAGTIDYESDALADYDKGHKDGVDLSKFIYGAEKLAAKSSTENAYLVPTGEFAGADTTNGQFTVYARYNDGAGARYRVVDVLAANEATTSVNDVASPADRAFMVSGSTLLAFAAIEVYDMSGRLCLRLGTGQSAEMAAGPYVVKTPAQSTKIMIR